MKIEYYPLIEKPNFIVQSTYFKGNTTFWQCQQYPEILPIDVGIWHIKYKNKLL